MARRQRLVLAALLGIGVGLIVLAGLIGNSGEDDVSVTNNPAVEALIPGRGDEVLQQQPVGIDLTPGYRLVSLAVSADAGCNRPVDVTAHTRHVEGLQRWTYTPGEGLPVAALAGEHNCVQATFAAIARPGETETIEWAFTVS